MRIEESVNVTFEESLPEPKSSYSVEDDRIDEPIVQDLNGQNKMDDPDLTMEEYIELEAEKARRYGPTFDWETAMYGRPLDNNEVDFRISFDESDDEDYICIYEKSSFSYKLISVNDLKTDLENGIDEVSIPPNDVVIE
ncbi:hypothetical protein Tco_1028059 [Tanacetum coccineum]